MALSGDVNAALRQGVAEREGVSLLRVQVGQTVDVGAVAELYRETATAVLGEAGSFSIVAGALGILVTSIYMAGLLERRDPAVGGIGLDSIAVAVCYLGGVALLFGLR